MKEINLDKIILGHNQFFGINHMSQERGAERDSHFSYIDNVTNIIKYAYSKGAGGLMLSTHPRSKLIINAILKDRELKENLSIYILLPYMAKYVRMANEKGIVNMIGDTLGQASWKEKLNIISKGSMGVLKKDLASMFKALINVELLSFKGLNVKAIFLHNALTDLIVGLNLSEIAKIFIDYVNQKYNVLPAFCTLNSPLVMNFLLRNGVINPVLMAPFNPIGFQMNPSRETAEKCLHEIPSRMVAMSTLAAGCVKPIDAAAYLSSLNEIKSVVVGASNRKHIDETFRLFREL